VTAQLQLINIIIIIILIISIIIIIIIMKSTWGSVYLVATARTFQIVVVNTKYSVCNMQGSSK
jgi:hypothetical protein